MSARTDPGVGLPEPHENSTGRWLLDSDPSIRWQVPRDLAARFMYSRRGHGYLRGWRHGVTIRAPTNRRRDS